MPKTKAQLENELRDDVLAVINRALTEHYQTDILDVSTSELTLPLIDSERNEKFVLIKVSIPRGTRVDGGYEPYDGYAAHEDWQLEKEGREERKRASEAKKEAAEKQREAKRAAKATIKTMKQEVNEILPNAAQEVRNDPTIKIEEEEKAS